jgi:hypothetical protein
MKHPIARSIFRSTLLSSLFLTFVCACSTFPPAQPAKDLRNIVGKWEGWATHLTTGRFYMNLTVKENGKWEMTTEPPYLNLGRNFSGTVSIREEKFQFRTDTQGLSGTYTIHYFRDKRWLIFTNDDGDIRAELRQ